MRWWNRAYRERRCYEDITISAASARHAALAFAVSEQFTGFWKHGAERLLEVHPGGKRWCNKPTDGNVFECTDLIPSAACSLRSFSLITFTFPLPLHFS